MRRRPGAPHASITAKKGIACSWLHQTSGDTLQVAVANLPEADIAARKSALKASSHPVGDFGADGYFTTTGGAGVAEAFTGSFWIVANSSYFGEPAEAAAIVNAAAKSLRLEPVVVVCGQRSGTMRRFVNDALVTGGASLAQWRIVGWALKGILRP